MPWISALESRLRTSDKVLSANISGVYAMAKKEEWSPTVRLSLRLRGAMVGTNGFDANGMDRNCWSNAGPAPIIFETHLTLPALNITARIRSEKH